MESNTTDLPFLKGVLQLRKQMDAPSLESLPKSYKANSDVEKLYLWSAENFRRQIRQKFPHLHTKFLTCANECQVEKLIMTFIKPTVLPFAHLFDIGKCAQFICDFIAYKPEPRLEDLNQINSPTLTMLCQVGNSLEMSHCLVSLLTGFGFQAFVVCGQVDPATANRDRTTQGFALGKELETTKETNLAIEKGHYQVLDPPVLESKYTKFLEGLDHQLWQGQKRKSQTNNGLSPTNGGLISGSPREPGLLHAWVYVELSEGQRGFFIEATDGERRPLSDPRILTIDSVWNASNYWLSTSGHGNDAIFRDKMTLELDSNEIWIKFVADIEPISKGHADKRLLKVLHQWLAPLEIPQSSYELTFRLGQKVDYFKDTKVEYFAPYLLKDGLVQRIQRFDPETESTEDHLIQTCEKFRYRTDQMTVRETFTRTHQVVESFAHGRPDHLKEHQFFKHSGGQPAQYLSKFYHESRSDGLEQRDFKDLEITEKYSGRLDGLQSMKAVFIIAEKKFGPADNTKRYKEVAKIIETYAGANSIKDAQTNRGAIIDPRDIQANPGRILDTSQIMEKVYDIEDDHIQIKFHRVEGQIFCKSVEFLQPRSLENDEDLTREDVKVYMVDPRDEEPCLKELKVIFGEELRAQAKAKARVDNVEKEMSALLEQRMREHSANDLDVWVFDVKRNAQVKRGRQNEERIAKLKEKSVVDLELDFLGPYLERHQEDGPLNKAQVIKIQQECLANVKRDLEEKEHELEAQMEQIKKDLKNLKAVLTSEDINSKKFLLNVIQTRLSRQKKHTIDFFAKAEKTVTEDPRVLKYL
ncbi:hypothetical protein TCAL_04253 [Tigriopus californicus]|uniref:Dynein regulatory complex subunit 7 MORN domain-containing protein n=1 Tax=Tigriopus californicus TaxID=6832 RepID=A0A553PLH0_TIGCA|nr:dynein regulatory complex subunit 7-like [Tigriopus californicus]TRY78534.1 hypothetical protein TCAL_04253 [Tigriopus californicus]|eukprot:TCALIF_04253-PA protein Name:"Similar to CCDC135 Coiled-coil domain-containing protein lobo homolog (Macaca fascicularis)" AED:0.10 eAED:0.09 QI:14/0.75/0.2/0.8/1/1/5/0/810